MKIGRINIQPNDDGTYQVDCEFTYDNGEWYNGSPIRYSAKSIEDLTQKIKKAIEKIKGMKNKTKKKGPDSRSIKEFIYT